jgi:hypothetical protein
MTSKVARDLAADAVALSKEHADRADAAEARWLALRAYLETCLRGCRRDAALMSAPPDRDRLDARGDAYDSALAMMTELEDGR